jgi:hypothetical protein
MAEANPGKKGDPDAENQENDETDLKHHSRLVALQPHRRAMVASTVPIPRSKVGSGATVRNTVAPLALLSTSMPVRSG